MITNPHIKALYALMDAVEELALGVAAGNPPNELWVTRISETFNEHRRALRTEESAWEEHSVAVDAIRRIEEAG
jgi:hypothetical protein